MSFKKGKKLLARADPVQRRRWIRHVRPLMKRAWRSDKRLLVFIDEAHIHCDLGVGLSGMDPPIIEASACNAQRKSWAFGGIGFRDTARTSCPSRRCGGGFAAR